MAKPTFEEWITGVLERWWEGLAPDTREVLIEATDVEDLAPATVSLLIQTSCPVGPVGTQWEGDNGYAWSWSGRTRDFVRGEQEKPRETRTYKAKRLR